MNNANTLEQLAAKLNAAPSPEPIFSALVDEYIDSADYDGWAPGGIGRVIEDMAIATNPDRKD